MTVIEGLMSAGENTVFSSDCNVTVKNATVKDASGKVIGKVLSAEVRDGLLYATMEVEDGSVGA